jgi:hypothetical protein
MDHSRASEFAQSFLDDGLIANVAVDERQRLPANLPDAFECRSAAVGKVVEDNNLAAGIEKLNAGVRTDISGATGHQDH